MESSGTKKQNTDTSLVNDWQHNQPFGAVLDAEEINDTDTLVVCSLSDRYTSGDDSWTLCNLHSQTNIDTYECNAHSSKLPTSSTTPNNGERAIETIASRDCRKGFEQLITGIYGDDELYDWCDQAESMMDKRGKSGRAFRKKTGKKTNRMSIRCVHRQGNSSGRLSRRRRARIICATQQQQVHTTIDEKLDNNNVMAIEKFQENKEWEQPEALGMHIWRKIPDPEQERGIKELFSGLPGQIDPKLVMLIGTYRRVFIPESGNAFGMTL